MNNQIGHILGLAALTIPGATVFVPLAAAPFSYFFSVLFIYLAKETLIKYCFSLNIFIIAMVLLGWVFTSLLWTIEPIIALEKIPRLIMSFMLGIIPIAVAKFICNEQKNIFAKYLVVGFCFCLVTLIIGLARENGGLLPFVEPHNGVPGKEVFRMNRGATILAILLWPTIVLTVHKPFLSIAFVIVAMGTIICSASNAAIAGVTVSVAVFGFIWLRPKLTCNILFAACVLYIMFAPVIHSKLTDPKIFNVTSETIKNNKQWFPRSAYHRLLIWSFVSKKTFEKPITGWGFYSSRVMPGGEDKLDLHETALPLHPHNGILQVWAELGCVGALILIILCFSIRKTILKLQGRIEFAAATSMFMCSFVIICVSYGVWQSWWIAILMLLSAFFLGSCRSGQLTQKKVVK